MSALAAIPLPLLPVLVYNLFVLGLARGFAAAYAPARLAAPLFSMRTAPGGVWPVSGADLIAALAIVTLFLELVRPRAGRRAAIANQALSVLLFVACLTQMLVWPAFATSAFFLVTLTVLLDVLAGLLAAISDAHERAEAGE